MLVPIPKGHPLTKGATGAITAPVGPPLSSAKSPASNPNVGLARFKSPDSPAERHEKMYAPLKMPDPKPSYTPAFANRLNTPANAESLKRTHGQVDRKKTVERAVRTTIHDSIKASVNARLLAAAKDRAVNRTTGLHVLKSRKALPNRPAGARFTRARERAFQFRNRLTGTASIPESVAANITRPVTAVSIAPPIATAPAASVYSDVAANISIEKPENISAAGETPLDATKGNSALAIVALVALAIVLVMRRAG